MSAGTVTTGPPASRTPTLIAFDRQLSLQAPPTWESLTCANVSLLQPFGRGTWSDHPPSALARVVYTRSPTRTLTSAAASAQRTLRGFAFGPQSPLLSSNGPCP